MTKSFILSLALAAVAAAQAPPQQQPQSLAGVVRLNRAPVSNTVLPVKLPRPVERKLANGARLLVIESHRVPLVTFQMMIPTGNLRDPQGLPGVAAATAALMRLGTKTRSAKEIADTIAELGATVNIAGGTENGSIMVSALTENFDAALAVLADILQNATFPQDEFDKWKTRMRAQIEQSKSQPGALATERMLKVLYPSDARQYFRPTLASLDKMTREDLLAHYKKYYVPSGEWAGIAGDITPAQAVAKLDKVLGSWKGGPVDKLSLPIPAPITEKKVYLIPRPNSVQTMLYVTNLAIDRTNPDYIDCMVMNQVLGSGPSSRLFRIVREEKGFTYGISSGFNASHFHNTFAANTSVRTEVTEPALAEVLKQFTEIREKPVPDGELADAKSAIVASFVLGLENPASVLGRWMTQREYGFPEDYWDQYTAKVMAVTAADVQRVAKKYVPADSAQIIVVGDAGKIGELMKKFGPVEEVPPEGN
ncbi:MAG TPA: pitrilysin family protein [Bryobacteraceae bacterium]|nr:pitrilysin family protein [Bryobacteraceae bacterium]